MANAATSNDGAATQACGPTRPSPTTAGGYNSRPRAASSQDEPSAMLLNRSTFKTPGAAVAAIASVSNQPIAPANRGRVTVIAHGSVDTSAHATTLPGASADTGAPPTAIASTSDTTSHAETPGSIDIIQ